jgi:hypothetical protein
MLKYIAVGIAVATLSMPAFAATEFFVAKDAATKKCSVVDKKPDEKTAMMVGKASFDTKAKADDAMKAEKDCK